MFLPKSSVRLYYFSSQFYQHFPVTYYCRPRGGKHISGYCRARTAPESRFSVSVYKLPSRTEPDIGFGIDIFKDRYRP